MLQFAQLQQDLTATQLARGKLGVRFSQLAEERIQEREKEQEEFKMGLGFLATKLLPMSAIMIAIAYIFYEEWKKQQESYDAGYEHKKDDDFEYSGCGSGAGGDHSHFDETHYTREAYKDQQEERICPICASNYDKKTRHPIIFLPCHHAVCLKCSMKLVSECPVCRGKIRDRTLLQVS